MQYSVNNITVSVLVNASTVLKAAGWNVFWHATGETETHTAGGDALGTVSLLQDIPEYPTFVTMPSAGDYAKQDNIVLPAFAIDVVPPQSLRRYGLGDYRFERQCSIRLAGIAASKQQQTALASTLLDWLQVGEGHESMSIRDYETNPASPVDLEDAFVWFANVAIPEVAATVESARYRVNVNLILRFVE